MTMKPPPDQVFGEMPPLATADFELVPTPVGVPCDFCGMPIRAHDTGAMIPSTENPQPGVLVPQHKFCAAIEAYQTEREWRHQAEAWAARWKALAKRYRARLERLRPRG